MASSPTREEVEAVLVALDEATKEGAGPLAQQCEDMLRALLARVEAAEREGDDWKRRAEDMHRRVTAAEGCAYNRWMRDQRDAARAEAALLSAIENRCWDVRCVDVPTGGGDSDVAWVVIEHHMAPPRERQVGYGNSPAAAIRAALAGEAGHDR